MMKSLPPDAYATMQAVLQSEFGPAVTLTACEAGFTLTVPPDSNEHKKMPEITQRLHSLIEDAQEKKFFERDCRLYTLLVDSKGHRHLAITAGDKALPDEVLVANTREQFARAMCQGHLLCPSQHKLRFKDVDDVRIARSAHEAKTIAFELTEFGFIR